MTIKLQTDKVLEAMAKTFRERNSTYGDNYLTLGAVMVALFPKGVVLKTEEDFIKYHFFDWAIGKFTRFTRTGMTHMDSLHDTAVYLAMMEDYLTQIKEKDNEQANNK